VVFFYVASSIHAHKKIRSKSLIHTCYTHYTDWLVRVSSGLFICFSDKPTPTRSNPFIGDFTHHCRNQAQTRCFIGKHRSHFRSPSNLTVEALHNIACSQLFRDSSATKNPQKGCTRSLSSNRCRERPSFYCVVASLTMSHYCHNCC